MLYREWRDSNEEDAKNIEKFVSMGGKITLPNGCIDGKKIENMAVMMAMKDADGKVTMYLC